MIFFAGTLVYISDLGTFLVILSAYFFFPETLDGLIPGTYFSVLEIFLIFMIIVFGVNLSCFTLFDDLDRENYGELISMYGENFNIYRCRRWLWSS